MERDIDVVIPMVFPQDAEWQADYERCKGGAAGTLRHARYRSWGTEELQVRCIRKFMPWVHRIHLLLARESQVQPWMEPFLIHPTPSPSPDRGGELLRQELSAPLRGGVAEGRGGVDVRIHFHREFVPQGYLPCFSSPCFEMFLGRIPGLSEQFIYANDDMFPLSPLKAEDFFMAKPVESSKFKVQSNLEPETLNLEPAALLPCHHFNELPAPAGPNLFERKCMFQLNMVGAPFGRSYKHTWLKAEHTFAPILKSSCDEVWRRHGDEISRHLNPLKRTDRSMNHYVYMLYQMFAGLSIDRSPRSQYIGASKTFDDIRRIIREADAGIVCINDKDSIDNWQQRARIVRQSIEDKLKTEDKKTE